MSTIQTLKIEKIEEYQELVKNHGIGAVPGIYKALSEMQKVCLQVILRLCLCWLGRWCCNR